MVTRTVYAEDNELPHDPADLLERAYEHAMYAVKSGVALKMSPDWLVTKVEDSEVKPCQACLAGAVMLGLQYVPRLVQAYRSRNLDVVGLTAEEWREFNVSELQRGWPENSCELMPSDGRTIGVSAGDICNLDALNYFRSGRLLIGLCSAFSDSPYWLDVLSAEWSHKLGCDAKALFDSTDPDTEEGSLDIVKLLPPLIAAYRKISPALREKYVALRRERFGPGGGEESHQ